MKTPKIIHAFITEYYANEIKRLRRYSYAVRGGGIYRIVMVERMVKPRFRKNWSPLTHKCTAILIEDNSIYGEKGRKVVFTVFPPEKMEDLEKIKTAMIDN